MDFVFLSRTGLFWGISAEEIAAMLNRLQAETRRYEGGAFIYRMGETVRSVGLVLSGRVQLESDDFWGNRSILDSVAAGKVFAETYACIPDEPLMVNAVAVEPTEVLFLNVERVLHACPTACPHHSRLVQNLLLLSARKNLRLSRRIFHTAPKTIRGRLLAYLTFEAQRQGARAFDIPFNRQQLADYLNVDRSALSAELGRMQRDGLICVRKNRFVLTEDENGMNIP